MKLITKMVSFGAALVVMMLVVVTSSYFSLAQMRTTITALGDEDMPLNVAVAEIAARQYSQSAWMERALLAAELGMTDSLANAKENFEGDHEIIETALGAANGIVSGADASQELSQFDRGLKEIEAVYGDYHDNGVELLRLLQAGDILAAEQLLKTVQDQSQALSELVTDVRDRVVSASANAADEAVSASNAAIVFLSVLGLLVIASATGLSILITRSILRQLGADPAELEQMADHLANGDLDIEIGARTGVAASISNTVERLRDVIRGIQNSAEEVSVASAQVGQGNTDLSQRTQEQASSLEEVAASMEEMTSTVNQNAENATQANELAREATSKAEQGGDIASRAVSAMGEISDASRQIADIINVIDDIAFQINLLALNAAVEAARAGDQGRGFAVVAGEVRNLAGRSATAAKEIKELIQDSVGKVEAGTELVGESGTRLTDIVGSIKRVSDNIAEIAAASREQSDGITQVNRAILQMDDMTQQNASLVEEAAAASETVDNQARQLKQLVAFFKVSAERSNIVARPVSGSTRYGGDDFAARVASTLAPARDASARSAQKQQPVLEDNWEEF